ncbi:MAG TPA: 50S ribosomal protein L29 [Candidatus Absconditabacterales bacterium]|nr:50S ribosomal protein L29 [Candidatus Absconditabacterales bacterium]HOQ79087.1 50S ribosomal protein L29 [Candidatus Absconditabacterales bacterium]HPK27630.1 50S ribosomal protein L29 [Candidatus Absconditabacterales bacterium]
MKGKGAYIKQLNEKTIRELISERKKLKKELYNLKMKNAIRGLKETHKIGEIRVNIARVNTVLKSKISIKPGQ